MILAMGTVPVSAGMGNIRLVSAVVIGASGQHMRAMLLSALFHGLQGFSMPRQDDIFILGKKPVFKFIDNRGEKDHFTPPQLISKLFTSVLMAWQALFPVLKVRCVYLDVVSTLTWPSIFCNSMRSTPASSKCVA